MFLKRWLLEWLYQHMKKRLLKPDYIHGKNADKPQEPEPKKDKE